MLTPVTLYLAWSVSRKFGNAAYENGYPKTAAQWLVLGIAVGFIGKLADNLYWTATWTQYDFGFGNAESWIAAGPVVDIFFRQLPLIVSGLCHLAALRAFTGERHVSDKF